LQRRCSAMTGGDRPVDELTVRSASTSSRADCVLAGPRVNFVASRGPQRRGPGETRIAAPGQQRDPRDYRRAAGSGVNWNRTNASRVRRGERAHEERLGGTGDAFEQDVPRARGRRGLEDRVSCPAPLCVKLYDALSVVRGRSSSHTSPRLGRREARGVVAKRCSEQDRANGDRPGAACGTPE